MSGSLPSSTSSFEGLFKHIFSYCELLKKLNEFKFLHLIWCILLIWIWLSVELMFLESNLQTLSSIFFVWVVEYIYYSLFLVAHHLYIMQPMLVCNQTIVSYFFIEKFNKICVLSLKVGFYEIHLNQFEYRLLSWKVALNSP